MIDHFSFSWAAETVSFSLPTFGQTPTLVIEGLDEWAGSCCVGATLEARLDTGIASSFALIGSLDVAGTILPFSFARQVAPANEFAGFLGAVDGVAYWLDVRPFVDAPLTHLRVPEANQSLLLLAASLAAGMVRLRD